MLRYPFENTPGSGETLEVAPGILWLRMPLPMELDHINLYLLEDSDGWWVVDTGIAIDPTQELWEGVFEKVFADKPLKAVISTHYHPDHTGMAGWLCERWRAPFYMTQGEYFTGLAYSRTTREHFTRATRVSPPGVTQVLLPLRTNGRRSRWRGSTLSSI